VLFDKNFLYILFEKHIYILALEWPVQRTSKPNASPAGCATSRLRPATPSSVDKTNKIGCHPTSLKGLQDKFQIDHQQLYF